MQPVPSGWYHAEGDPDGTVRYWDGSAWTAGPVAAATQATGQTMVSPAANPYTSSYAATPAATGLYGGNYYSMMQTAFLDRIYAPDELVTAGRWRRLSGSLLDSLLVLVTLFIGWFIWYCFTAPNGQTPGKKLLGMYIMKSDGTRAGGGYTWLREWVIKGLVGGFLASFTFYLYNLIAALWCLWDKNHQCLWDKMASTYVATSRNGFKPMTANELRLIGQIAPAFAPRPGSPMAASMAASNPARMG